MNKFCCFICFLVIAFLTSCNGSSEEVLLHHMDYIRQNGDSDPVKALTELYTLDPDVRQCGSDYVQNTYLLLKTRLQDKADMIPCSSDTIEAIVNYFDEHGSYEEQMEAYYYQGSVFRDLKDYPRSMTSFRKVLDIAEKYGAEDCRLLQNTYSQLTWQYDRQLLYDEALKTAKAGCSMAERTGTLDPVYLMDVSTAACFAGDTADAIRYCCKTMEYMKDDTLSQYPDVVCEMLIRFSEWDMRTEAEDCLAMLNRSEDARHAPNYLEAMASYCEHYSTMDSAMILYRRSLEESGNLSQKTEAAHKLFEYHLQEKSYEKAAEYATLFIQNMNASTQETQYEQTSRACGEHLYAISLEKEMRARKETADYRMRLYVVAALFLLSALVVSIVYGQQKKHHIRMLLTKEEALENAKDTIRRYDERLSESAHLVDGLKKKLASLESETKALEKEMAKKMEEKELIIRHQKESMMTLNKAIAENEAILMERQKQIKELVRLSLMEKASIDSGDVVQKFHDASFGKGKIEEDDWRSLYSAVELMYPGFKEAVMSVPRNSDLSIKTAYLIKIGLNNSQIANLTNSSRQTVWDRVKKARGHLEKFIDSKV